jgi:hypothetical protein
MKTKLLGVIAIMFVALLAAWAPGMNPGGRVSVAPAGSAFSVDTPLSCPPTYTCLPKVHAESGLGTGGHRVMMRLVAAKEFCGWMSAGGKQTRTQMIVCEVPFPVDSGASGPRSR